MTEVELEISNSSNDLTDNEGLGWEESVVRNPQETLLVEEENNSPECRHWVSESKKPILMAFFVLMIMVFMVSVAFSASNKRDRDKEKEIFFDKAAEKMEFALSTQWSNLLLLQMATRQLILTYDPHEIPRDNFTNFVLPLDDALATFNNGQSPIQAWSYIPRVWDKDRQEYEERAAIELDIRDYTFMQTGPGGYVPRDTQDYYFPIYLIDPLESNRAAPAFDINSNPLRHEALVKAASTSLPVTTENIVLVSETGTQSGVLSILPVFSKVLTDKNYSRVKTSDPLTRADMMGMVLFVLRIDDFVKTAKFSVGGTTLDISIYDAYDPENKVLLYTDDYPDRKEEFKYVGGILANDRYWEVVIYATDEFLGDLEASPS